MKAQRLQERFEFLDSNGIQCLQEYVTLAMAWNAKIQFTATRDVETFWERHVCDSLMVASKLNEIHTSMRDAFGPGIRVLDVGSGGGLPGVILAIACPNWEILAIEPVHKKHSFLAQCRRKLGLQNFQSEAIRDEELFARPDFRPFDLAVARAVWDVAEWVERGRRLVTETGWVLAMEGREQILQPAPPGAQRYSYSLEEGRQRAILLVPGANP